MVMSFLLPHDKAPDFASGLHVAAGNVCATLAEGFPPRFLVLESFGPSVLLDAEENKCEHTLVTALLSYKSKIAACR